MAAEIDTGMEKPAMKMLLVKSKKEPVNCAVAQADGKVALLMLDRIKAPKALLKELQKQFPDLKMPAFGNASVDVDNDPKLVRFCLNKAPSGIGRKLVKTLKGTGFSKVAVMLEDGTAVETVSEEDEAAPDGAPPPPQAGAAAAAPAPAAPAPEAAPAPAPAPQAAPAAPGADMGTLTRDLTNLVKRLAQADPAQLGALKAFAVQAQAALKAGDAKAAAAAIEQLRAGLDQPAAPADAPADGQAAPDRATPAALAKARQAWVLTRKKMESDVDAVHKAMMSAFGGHGSAKDISAAFRTRVEKVLTSMDEALAHALDALAAAVDPREHADAVQTVTNLLNRYEAFVTTDATIAALDGNPFAPVAIRKTTTATLAALRKTVR